MEEIIPVGPLRVSVRDPARASPRLVRWRVGNRTERVLARDGWLHLGLPTLHEHELAVIE
jgi:hypothetical protein